MSRCCICQKTGCDFRVKGSLDDTIQLNSLCQYATTCSLESNSESPENPYEIAKAVLRQSGYRIDEGWSLPHTSEICHFITYPNQTVMDATKYLLSYGIGETGQSSPAYLIHSLRLDSGRITTIEQLFQDQNIESYQPDSTKMAFSITQPLLMRRSFMMTGISRR